jgi:DNA-binding NarL/FixJ family response regulator
MVLEQPFPSNLVFPQNGDTHSSTNGLTLTEIFAMKTKVCVFDDNERILESFSLMMSASDTVEITGLYNNWENVLQKIAESRAEVVIMDIEIPPKSGIEAVKTIRKVNTEIPIIMFTVFEDSAKIFDSICAGANGYLLKKTDPEKLIQSIEEVKLGGAPMTPSIARKVLEKFQENTQPTAQDYELTQREREILKLLTKGLSYKMIASECNISFETVRTHIKNIYFKLHVASSTEAVAKALNEKIV